MEEQGSGSAKIEIEAGTAVSLQISRLAHRLQGSFVGMVPGQCLILQVSQEQFRGMTAAYLWRSEVIGRYVHQGNVFGFKCTFLDLIEFPVSMAIIGYPQELETVQLRRHNRAPCFLPAGLQVGGGPSLDAFILDISEGGCCVSIQQGQEGQARPELQVGNEAVLRTTLLGTRGRQDFKAQVRNTHQEESGDLLVGLQFSQMAPDERSSVMQFILNTDTALRERTFRDFQDWQERSLPQDVLALYLDAYETEIEGDRGPVAFWLYSVAGLDFQGRFDLFDMLAASPDEASQAWPKLLKGLHQRGLRRTLFTVNGHRPHLLDASQGAFEGADLQLCFRQLMGRLRKKVHPDHDLYKDLAELRNRSDFREATDELNRLVQLHHDSYPELCRQLEERACEYLVFLNLPSTVRGRFAELGPLNELFALVEGFRKSAGGRFDSANDLRVKAFWALWRLRSRWEGADEQLLEHMPKLEERFEQIFLSRPNRKDLMKRAAGEEAGKRLDRPLEEDQDASPSEAPDSQEPSPDAQLEK